MLKKPEESVLKTGLNFSETNHVFNLDIAFAAEFAGHKFPLRGCGVLMEDSINVRQSKTFDISCYLDKM
jgi:hypothetical protein